MCPECGRELIQISAEMTRNESPPAENTGSAYPPQAHRSGKKGAPLKAGLIVACALFLGMAVLGILASSLLLIDIQSRIDEIINTLGLSWNTYELQRLNLQMQAVIFLELPVWILSGISGFAVVYRRLFVLAIFSAASIIGLSAYYESIMVFPGIAALLIVAFMHHEFPPSKKRPWSIAD